MKTDVIGQKDFTGGMQLKFRPTGNQYGYSRNIIIRDGKPTTRPGIQRLTRPKQETSDTTFWFGDQTDQSGFWFPFYFSNAPIIGDIDGFGTYRFDGTSTHQSIVVTNGQVLININGQYVAVRTDEDITGETGIRFINGNNQVIMCRGDEDTLIINQGDESFSKLADVDGALEVPNADFGIYAFNRFWLVSGSTVHASDLLDSSKYSLISQSFDFDPGDGEDITALVEFKDDYLLVFKSTKIYVISGINTPIESGGLLSDYVVIDIVDSGNIGCVNQQCVAVKGEQVYFMSKVGVSSLSRTTEGNVYGVDIKMSDPIRPIYDTINFGQDNMCMAYFDNYLLFSVPVNYTDEPNNILVYDLTMGENGAWVGVWDSVVELPIMMYRIDDNTRLVGLCSDGVVRSFFNDDPWDSEDPTFDTYDYQDDVLYPAGAVVRNSDNDRLYEAVFESIGNNPSTSPSFWVELDDGDYQFDIETSFRTMMYGDGSEHEPKKVQRAEILYRQIDSNVTLSTINDFAGGDPVPVITDKFPDYIKYKNAFTPDYENDNSNLDFNVEYREDYSWFISDAGFYIDRSGIDIGDWTEENLRFTLLRNIDYGYGVEIKSTKGKIKIHSIALIYTPKRFAGKGR